MIQSVLFKSRNVIRMQMQQFYGQIQHIINNTPLFNGGLHHQQQQQQLQLITDGIHYNNNINGISIIDAESSSSKSLLDDLCIWFAVPKQKVSHQKKRMKTTLRTRIPIRKNIITDPRTGELTLRHHLPFNWRNYLPNAIGMNNNNTEKPE